MSNIDFPFKLLAATHGIADSRTPPIERRNYECTTVEFIYKGKGFLEINGESFCPVENSVYILHKHSDHRYWPDKGAPWAKIFFVIDGALMDSLFEAYGLAGSYFIPSCPQLKKYFDEMIRLRNGIGDIDSQASVVFHRFLDECRLILHRQPGQLAPKGILDLKNFLDNSVEAKVNMDKYCRERRCSYANMIRQFKKNFGSTPYDYLMRRRIDEARLMLRHSALSVKEIASRLMFTDQYYFSNYFKRKTGRSPQKYRKGV